MHAMTKKLIRLAAQNRFQEKEGDKWCVRCALSNAKDVFDKIHGEFKLPTHKLLWQTITDFKETPYDAPLVEARNYLSSINFILLFKTRNDAQRFMLESIDMGPPRKRR